MSGLASRFNARAHHRSTIASRPILRIALRVVLLVVAMLLWRFGVPMAHEIPPSVVVRAFVKAEGQRLRVLVRVPLEAMRDVVRQRESVGNGERAGTADAVSRSRATAGLNGDAVAEPAEYQAIL